MIASSPRTAALLRASPALTSSSGYDTAPTTTTTAVADPSQAQPPSQPHRLTGFPNTSSSVGVDQIQSVFRRQTVDAGTQYSPTPSPSQKFVPTSRPSHQDSQTHTGPDPNLTVDSAKTNPRMLSTSASSKRNTPDKPHPTAQPRSRNNGEPESDRTASKRHRPEKPAPKVLPRQYEEANCRDLVILISSMLMELIRRNDQIPLRDGRLTRFHSRSPPRISVPDYLQRLTTHATLSPPILLSMVYYIDRLCILYPAFTISSLTVHRFLISSATVASKGLSDSFWTNKTYARVGGISVDELALLELEFLWRVEWRIIPQPVVLVDYYRNLVDRCDDYVLEPESDKTQAAPQAQAPLQPNIES